MLPGRNKCIAIQLECAHFACIQIVHANKLFSIYLSIMHLVFLCSTVKIFVWGSTKKIYTSSNNGVLGLSSYTTVAVAIYQTLITMWYHCMQWRRHGGDWGGTVPPTAQSGHFCESSKSDEKNLAVWVVTSSSIFEFLLNKVTKSIFFSQAMLFYFNHLYD